MTTAGVGRERAGQRWARGRHRVGSARRPPARLAQPLLATRQAARDGRRRLVRLHQEPLQVTVPLLPGHVSSSQSARGSIWRLRVSVMNRIRRRGLDPTTAPATAHCCSTPRSPRAVPGTSGPALTGPRSTARSSAITAPWPASGPISRPGPATPNEPAPCRTSSTATTTLDPTPHSRAGPQPVAYPPVSPTSRHRTTSDQNALISLECVPVTDPRSERLPCSTPQWDAGVLGLRFSCSALSRFAERVVARTAAGARPVILSAVSGAEARAP